MKIFFTIIKFVFLSSILMGQAFEGMTLFSPTQGGGAASHATYLMDNDLNIIHSWTHTKGAASMAYLRKDSILVYPYRVSNPSMNSGGVGGGIALYNWEGDLLWSYEFANETYQHHHDVEPLPNGNILILVWEKKTAAEAFAMGRETIDNGLNEMWSTAILEIEPIGINETVNDVNIVWEWHVWDHLIQDIDPTLPNYGVISDHPELQDINYGNAGTNNGPGGANGDWKHCNAVDYNESLDQIAFSSRFHDEIYIIDHSTTTEEAAGHTGGLSGKGGDFLFRWGNPESYGRGNSSNHLLSDQHGVNWIPDGYPGEGNLILFNNNYTNNTSAVFEIIPPINESGGYEILPGEPFGPEAPTWFYAGNFHTQMQGGAFRLPNGNTLVTDCNDAKMFEVTLDYEVVWEHDYGGQQTFIARAQKYPMDYLLSAGFPDYTLGDVNFDSNIDVIDLLFISDMVAGLGYEWTPPADFYPDDQVTITDVIWLLQYILYN